jgi:hypothetical protein
LFVDDACETIRHLREHNPETLRTVPDIGGTLAEVQSAYYEFKRLAIAALELMMERVGANVGVRFPQAWRIYVRYAFMRIGGATREAIERGGNFLNYGITWDDAERVAGSLQNDAEVTGRIEALGTSHENLLRDISELRRILAV